MDSGLLQEAAAEWVRTSKWMPKPFELISIANDIEHEQRRHQALPAPKRYRPSADYTRRVYAKCQAMGVNNPTVNRWMAELESERVA